MERIRDDTDLALMRELQADGRATNVALARTVGLSEGAVRQRVDRLIGSGAIQIAGVPDPRAIGLNTHAVICMQVDMQQLEAAEQQLVAMEEISFVYETAGPYDLIVVGFFPSTEDLRSFLTVKIASLPGVMRTDTFHIMRTVKRSYRYIRPAPASAGTAPRRPAERPRRRPARRALAKATKA